MLKKQIKKHLRSGKIAHVHGLAKLLTFEMAILPKTIYRVNAISMQISMVFFTESEKNLHMET